MNWVIVIVLILFVVLIFSLYSKKQKEKKEKEEAARRLEIAKREEARQAEIKANLEKQAAEEAIRKQEQAAKDAAEKLAREKAEAEAERQRAIVVKKQIEEAEKERQRILEQEQIVLNDGETRLPKPYFNGYEKILARVLPPWLVLEPIRHEKIEIDKKGLSKLKNDRLTMKSMPAFCGEGAEERIEAYLENTILCTKMGIAFAFALREFINPMSESNTFYGIIKVTAPSHNIITNNFHGWLIDFVMIPEKRNHGFMSMAVGSVLDKVEDLGAKEIYAMVMEDNLPSIAVLIRNNFKIAQGMSGGLDKITGKRSMLLVRKFD